MNGGPTSVHTASGKPKHSVMGKPGNVGGISPPGRKGSHAAAMAAGVKNLVSPGPGTKKTANVAKIRPEGPVHIVKTAGAKKTGAMPITVAGAPSKAVQHGTKITAAGHKGIHVGTR